MTPQRQRLPNERPGLTHRFVINAKKGDQIIKFKGYVTAGFFEDGTVGEVFVKMDKQGSEVSGFCDAWAIAVSMLLQSGTSLETICQKYRGAQFEPSGFTETEEIRLARSPVDYIVRWLELRFMEKSDAV